MLSSRSLALLAPTLLVLLVGCGGPRIVTVTGKVLKGGEPMKVSEDTYVTLSFIPDPRPSDDKTSSYSATFDQKSGTYSVKLPAGTYRTMLVMALPTKAGKLNAPRPVNSPKVHDLKQNQELNIEVPAK